MQTPVAKIAIGIQARSTSTRLPRKVHMVLTRNTVLEHIIKACRDSAIYLNRLQSKRVSVYLLVPEGDEIVYKRNAIEVPIIEGPQDDVLTRYVMLGQKTKADYFCRVTADCPLIPHFLISKMITLAVVNSYDYVSNVDERCRTAPDGVDCEVFSRRMLAYLDENAKTPHAREHVTLLVRNDPPSWGHYGTVVGFFDGSDEKFSVDTEGDLNGVRDRLARVEAKYEMAVKIFGKHSVHRF